MSLNIELTAGTFENAIRIAQSLENTETDPPTVEEANELLNLVKSYNIDNYYTPRHEILSIIGNSETIIQKFLKWVADDTVDKHVRICLMTILSSGFIGKYSNKCGAYKVCLDILSTTDCLILQGCCIRLFNGGSFDSDYEKKTNMIIEMVKTLDSSDDSIVLKNSRTISRLGLVYYDLYSRSDVCEVHCLPDIHHDRNALKSLCRGLKQASNPIVIDQIASIVYLVAQHKTANTCNRVLIEEDIISILMAKLFEMHASDSLTTYNAVLRALIAIAPVNEFGRACIIEELTRNQAYVSCLQSIILGKYASSSIVPRLAVRIVAAVAYSKVVDPIITAMSAHATGDSDNMIYLMGLLVGLSALSYVKVKEIALPIMQKRLLQREGVLTVGYLRLLIGILAQCETSVSKDLVQKGAVSEVVKALQADSSEPIAWEALQGLLQTSSNPSEVVNGTDIFEMLLSNITPSNKLSTSACLKVLNQLLETEDVVASLPSDRFVECLAALIIPSDDFVFQPDQTPLYITTRAASALKKLVQSQPAKSKKAVTEAISKSTLPLIAQILNQPRCLFVSSSNTFQELVNETRSSDFYQSWITDLAVSLSSQSSCAARWQGFAQFVRLFPPKDKKIGEFKPLLLEKSLSPQILTSVLLVLGSLPQIQLQPYIEDSVLNPLLAALLNPSTPMYAVGSIWQFMNSVIGTIKSDTVLEYISRPDVISSLVGHLRILKASDSSMPLNTLVKVMSNMLQKAKATGEVKFTSYLAAFRSQDILSILVELASRTSTIQYYSAFASDLYSVFGLFGVQDSDRPLVLSLLQSFSIESLVQMCKANLSKELLFADPTLLQKVKDLLTDKWSSLSEQTRSRILTLIPVLADSKSVTSTASLELIPRLLELVDGFINSSATSMKHEILLAGIRCIESWCKLGLSGLQVLSKEPKFVDILVKAVEVCMVTGISRDALIVIIDAFASQNDFKPLVTNIVQSLSKLSSDSIFSRESVINLAFLTSLSRLNNVTLPMITINTILCNPENGLMKQLLDALQLEPIDRLRIPVTWLPSFIACLLQCAAGIDVFNSLNGSKTLAQMLKTEVLNPSACLFPIVCYAIKGTRKDTDSLLDAKLLDNILPIVKDGPQAKGYFDCLQLIQLVSLRGSDKQRDRIAVSEACHYLLKWLSMGILPSNMQSRSYMLAGIYCKQLPIAKEYLKTVIDDIDAADSEKTVTVIKKLLQISPGSFAAPALYMVEAGIVQKLKPLDFEGLSESNQQQVMQLIYRLGKFDQKAVVPFAKVYAKQLNTKISENRPLYLEGYILSQISKVSSKAKATIRATVERVFEEWDDGDEKFAEMVLTSLNNFAYHQQGVDALLETDCISVVNKALSRSNSTAVKVSALGLLRELARQSDSARQGMREMVETCRAIITSNFHVVQLPDSDDPPVVADASSTSVSDAPATSNNPIEADAVEKKSFKYDVFLSHDWGKDGVGRDNHARVAAINKLLQAKGYVTWFDAEQMRGSVNSKMMDGITHSSLILVFLTDNYIKKASGLGPKGEDDNCFFEFDCASLERGRKNMIPLVMEPSCRDTSHWASGVVKGKLGNKLYFDLSGDIDAGSFNDNKDRLFSEIDFILSANGGAVNGTAVASAPSASLSPSTPRSAAVAEAAGSNKGTTSAKKTVEKAAISDDAMRVGIAALDLLVHISYSESVRPALDSDEVINMLDYLWIHYQAKCEKFTSDLITNVFGPVLDLNGGDGSTQKRYTRARALLKKYGVLDKTLNNFKTIMNDVFINEQMLSSFELCLMSLFNLSCIDEFRLPLVSNETLVPSLVQVHVEGFHNLVKLQFIHKTLASNILLNLSLRSDIRPKLLERGVDKALVETSFGVSCESESEEEAKLWYATKQALNSLTGKLDSDGLKNVSWLANPGSRDANTKAWSDDELSQIPVYNAFICHKRSDSQDFARILHSLIVSGNMSCFLDVENLDRIDILSLIVAGCDVFVCILSDGFFDSPFCKKELFAAVCANVPIILVVKEGSRWPGKDGLPTDPFPSTELIDQSFEPPFDRCRDVFKNVKAIQHSNEYFRAFSVSFVRKVELGLEGIKAKDVQTGVPARMRVLQQRRAVANFHPHDADAGKKDMEGHSTVPGDGKANPKLLGNASSGTLPPAGKQQLQPTAQASKTPAPAGLNLSSVFNAETMSPVVQHPAVQQAPANERTGERFLQDMFSQLSAQMDNISRRMTTMEQSPRQSLSSYNPREAPVQEVSPMYGANMRASRSSHVGYAPMQLSSPMQFGRVSQVQAYQAQPQSPSGRLVPRVAAIKSYLGIHESVSMLETVHIAHEMLGLPLDRSPLPVQVDKLCDQLGIYDNGDL